MERLKMQTVNKTDENFKKLAEMFPNAVTESIDEVMGEKCICHRKRYAYGEKSKAV